MQLNSHKKKFIYKLKLINLKKEEEEPIKYFFYKYKFLNLKQL